LDQKVLKVKRVQQVNLVNRVCVVSRVFLVYLEDQVQKVTSVLKVGLDLLDDKVTKVLLETEENQDIKEKKEKPVLLVLLEFLENQVPWEIKVLLVLILLLLVKRDFKVFLETAENVAPQVTKAQPVFVVRKVNLVCLDVMEVEVCVVQEANQVFQESMQKWVQMASQACLDEKVLLGHVD